MKKYNQGNNYNPWAQNPWAQGGEHWKKNALHNELNKNDIDKAITNENSEEPETIITIKDGYYSSLKVLLSNAELNTTYEDNDLIEKFGVPEKFANAIKELKIISKNSISIVWKVLKKSLINTMSPFISVKDGTINFKDLGNMFEITGGTIICKYKGKEYTTVYITNQGIKYKKDATNVFTM